MLKKSIETVDYENDFIHHGVESDGSFDENRLFS